MYEIILWQCTCFTTKMRSPGSPSIMGSPSSKNESLPPSAVPGSISTEIGSASRSYLTLSHSSHSCWAYCWYMPGPTCITKLRGESHIRAKLCRKLTHGMNTRLFTHLSSHHLLSAVAFSLALGGFEHRLVPNGVNTNSIVQIFQSQL